MIPALLIWLYKKYAMKALSKRNQQAEQRGFQKLATKTSTLSVALLFIFFIASGQEKIAKYHVLRNGSVIGEMQFHQKISGSDIFLKMNSNVKTRFVFGIDVQTLDQAHFRNGKLIYSNVYRNVNGKEKENKKTTWTDDRYYIQSGSKTSLFNNAISYNMMLLYCKEPLSISKVYSDNFQQFLTIKKMDSHFYRIDLPDGNYNDYYFKNGICRLVVVHHTMYTIQMELV